MDAASVQRHRQRLLALKAEILAADDIEPESARQEASTVGSDEDTQPLAEMSQSIASSRNRNRAGVLAQVLAALARLDDDPTTFGLCVECEEPIAAKRIELMPYAELCVECQQAKDGPRKQGGRRHLRDFQ
ncbi:MAG TPA: TraR/DksA family transcriptional regulator [Polyangia bacterium]|jgi:DnaK suppressor protein|nr:TraR/DksA family transcriptional regulator [Polyangia bacterium]